MTAPTEKAAPIPAEEREPFVIDENRRWIGVDATGLGGPEKVTRLQRVAEIWRDQGLAVSEWVRADREARPSLPDSREEQIREDERQIIVRVIRRIAQRFEPRSASQNNHRALADAIESGDAFSSADRARARQGGNNG